MSRNLILSTGDHPATGRRAVARGSRDDHRSPTLPVAPTRDARRKNPALLDRAVFLTFAVLGVGAVLPAGAAEGEAQGGLAISEEVVIDTGRRFGDYTVFLRCGIRQWGEQLAFLGASSEYDNFFYVRHLDGSEIAPERVHIGSQTSVLDAVLTDDGITTIEATDEEVFVARYLAEGGEAILVQRIADHGLDHDLRLNSFARLQPVGSGYQLVWQDHEMLRTVRLTADLKVTHNQSFSAQLRHHGFDAQGPTGMLAWVQSADQVSLAGLDGDGLWVERTPLEFAGPIHQASIAIIPEGALLAVLHGDSPRISWVRIDSDGTEVSPRRSIDGMFTEAGLLVAGAAHGGLLCWRSEFDVRALLLDLQGAPIGEPFEVGKGSWYPFLRVDPYRTRHLDADYVADRWVVCWNDHAFVTGTAVTCWSKITQPLWTRSISPAGEVLGPPVPMNRILAPYGPACQFRGDEYRVSMYDYFADGFLWADIAPETGQMLAHGFTSAAPPVASGRCDFTYPFASSGEGENLYTAYRWISETWNGSFYAEGTNLQRVGPGAEPNYWGLNELGAGSFDLQGTQLWFSFQDEDTPDEIRVYYWDANEQRRHWTLDMEVPHPATVHAMRLGGLLAWSDTRDGERDLWYRYILAQEPAGTLTGQRLFADAKVEATRLGWVNRPVGPVLFHSAANADGRLDLYSARFDGRGRPLDTAPRLIVQGVAANWRVLYDGFKFFVLWGDGEHLRAVRIRRTLDLLDDRSLTLFHLGRSDFDIASNGTGGFGVVYQGNRFRTVTGDGHTPVLVSGLSAQRTPDGVAVSWILSTDLFVEFDVLRMHDEHEVRVTGSAVPARVGKMSVLDDGAPSASGLAYVLDGRDRQGKSVRFGPAFVSGDEGGVSGDLSLGIRPNPAVGTVLIDLEVPRAGTVAVEVFDPRGRRVWSESVEMASAGRASVSWLDGHGQDGLASGVYLVRASQGRRTASGTVTILR